MNEKLDNVIKGMNPVIRLLFSIQGYIQTLVWVSYPFAYFFLYIYLFGYCILSWMIPITLYALDLYKHIYFTKRNFQAKISYEPN